MKKAILILIILILSLLYYTGMLTKKEILPFSKEFFSVESSGSSDRLWGLERGTSVNPKELDQLYQLKLDKGIRNVPTLSFLLIRESERARRKGDADRAIRAATDSIKFSPDLPQPYFELAQALCYQNPLQLHKILAELLRGVIMQFQYYPSSLRLFYNVFYILSNGILMTFIVLGVVVMVKYFPLYFYDIRKNLSQEISKAFHEQPKDYYFLHPVLPPSGHALGYSLLVRFVMGPCNEEGKTTHSGLSHRLSLFSFFPSFFLFFLGWGIFGYHFGDESDKS